MTNTSLTDPDLHQKSNILPSGNRRARPKGMVLYTGLFLIIVSLIGIFVSSTGIGIGLWSLGLMLVLIFLSVPVALSLIIPSIIGLFAASGMPAVVNLLSSSPYTAASQWSMSVLPMFIFMGMVLVQSGMTTELYRATGQWFSWLPGGAGISTTAAGAGLSSVSGSTIGMTYTLARAGIPEMLRAGYDKRIAVGTVIVAGLPGNLIPPSVLLVVYAGIASVPVGPQLVAGAVPGILVAVLFVIFIFLLGTLAPHLVGRGKNAPNNVPKTTWRSRWESLRDIWGFPIIMLVLFGGMFSGIFTTTEAGAAAAITALLLLVFKKRNDKPFQHVMEATVSTVGASGAIFFILIGAEMLTRLLAITGLAPVMTSFITDLGLSRVGFLVILVVFYLVMGLFFDTLSMMLLTIPILLPALQAMDVSPLWFGVFVVLLGELAMITPPLGVLTYIVHKIAQSPEVNLGQRISLRDVFVSLSWFLPIAVLFLLIMIAVPEMTEWLPNLLDSVSPE